MVLGDFFFKKREFVTEYSFFKVFVTKWQKIAIKNSLSGSRVCGRHVIITFWNMFQVPYYLGNFDYIFIYLFTYILKT